MRPDYIDFVKVGILVLLMTVISSLIYYYSTHEQNKNNKCPSRKYKRRDNPIIEKIEYLTQAQAQHRSSVIESPITYEMVYVLEEGNQFGGTVAIEFPLNELVDGLFLDFNNGKIHKLIINEKTVVAPLDLYNGIKIQLPKEHLVQGYNQVLITFSRNYNQNGHGLVWFEDTDCKEYIYSHSEPWHANKFIPSFDQPDIRATFSLTVIAPKQWTVLSNEQLISKTTVSSFKESSQTNLKLYQDLLKALNINKLTDRQYAVNTFKETKVISTYVFALAAGPYKQIELPQDQLYNNIPMSLYSRESLYDFLLKDSQEIFVTTIETMKFYEKYFGHKFQYSKYDHVFCPEYPIGAMENPGLITVNDQLIYKEAVVPDKKLSRAATVSHELSHMWFGDYVTIKWWNDTWLKESFADFLSYFALSQVQQIPGIDTLLTWSSFFQRKGGAFVADSQKTTHPIAGPVEDTQKAEVIFDSITYSKGAAALQQLYHLVGEDNFSEALKQYFDTYKWQSATLQNFLEAIQKVLSKKFDIKKYPHLDLDQWSRDWLQTSGTNEITVQWNPEESNINLLQSVVLPEHPTLRFHKLKLAFLDDNAQIYHVQEVILQNTTNTQITYTATHKQPAAIIPNYNDQAFISVNFDPITLNFLQDSLNKINNDLTRLIVWRSLSSQVQNAKMSSIRFLKIADVSIKTEENLSILQLNLDYSFTFINQYVPNDISTKYGLIPQFFERILRLLENTPYDNKFKIILLRNKLINFGKKLSDVQILLEWLHGKNERLKHVPLTIASKWQIALAVARNKQIQPKIKINLVQQLAKQDKSETGIYLTKQINAVFATPQEKEQIWQSFFDKDIKDSLTLTKYIMMGFNDASNSEDNHKYHVQFFQNLLKIFEERNQEFAIAFLTNLFPNSDNLEWILTQVQSILDSQPQGQSGLLKYLNDQQDLLTKRIKAYELIR